MVAGRQFAGPLLFMPAYYFRIQTGDDDVEDEEGSPHPDLQAARAYAVMAARELLAAAIPWGEEIPPDG
jgi:hypothetical protein